MPEVAEKEEPLETREDVGALYAWADLKGVRSHEVVRTRRALRARLREGSAEILRADELRAGAEAGAGNSPRPTESSVAGTAEASLRLVDRINEPRTDGRESMLPQRFPRGARARESQARLRDGGEASVLPALGRGLEKEAVAGIPQVAAVGWMSQAGEIKGLESVAGDGLVGAREVHEPPAPGLALWTEADGRPVPVASTNVEAKAAADVPAWLHGQASPAVREWTKGVAAPEQGRGAACAVTDTLQHSRERVAAQWYGLRDVFDPGSSSMEPTEVHTGAAGSPALGVFSLAGGVGKTSLTAALGRALAAAGERVLLADVPAQGLLPFYFGARELRPGVVRKFLPPRGGLDAPISLFSYELNGGQEGRDAGEELSAELARSGEDFDRVVVDLSPAAPWMAERLAAMDGVMLVPVAPDMNCVLGLSAVERFFAALGEGAARPVRPVYVLTQFDASLPLHLDVREVMRQQLGDRLLPFAIRRSHAVSEALAEGMTVIDYAPDSGVADDYRSLAEWVRTSSAPAQAGPKHARWSEG